MIKQNLSTKLGQSLSMTPQLQQAIKLLQLSSVELEKEIIDILESNPLLERADESPSNDKPIESDDGTTTSIENIEATAESQDIPEDLQIDANWDDIYDLEWKANPHAEVSGDPSDFIESTQTETQGLQEHLQWQINLSNLSVQDQAIATLITEYLDADGYLTEPLEQIYLSVKDIMLIDADEIEAILTYVQHLSPIGVASRDLEECLLIQLKQLHSKDPLYKKAKSLLKIHLDLLEKRDYIGIKRALRITTSVLEKTIKLIKKLEPKPGKLFNQSTTDYITPDVYIKKYNNTWRVSLNSSTQTELKVNSYYEDMLNLNEQQKALPKETRAYITSNLQQARWFINSLENRNSTLINVAHAIVKKQQAFFHYGEEAMKPMILNDLASELGVHESTISRVTTNKYMHTPRGMYEFKYFFSSHVSTDTGGECSATAIRAMITNLITKEDPKKPLSDNKLTALLNEQGINVARRTVAKYREAQAIPSSHERKVYA